MKPQFNFFQSKSFIRKTHSLVDSIRTNEKTHNCCSTCARETGSYIHILVRAIAILVITFMNHWQDREFKDGFDDWFGFRRMTVMLMLLIGMSGVAKASGSFTIDLDPGWNHISGEYAFTIDEITDDCELASYNGDLVWGYRNGWEHPNVLKPRLGYYINVDLPDGSTCTATITQKANAKTTTSLPAGWNNISWENNTQVLEKWSCDSNVDDGSELYHWNGSSWIRNRSSTTISPRRGYFIHLESSCSTSIEGDGDEGDDEERRSCVGGGNCYTSTITANDADTVLDCSATLTDLRDALSSASAGEVVFLKSCVEIFLPFDDRSSTVKIPAGVTLASDRGVGGSDGARLYAEKKPDSDWYGSDTISVNDNARLTGLRIEGPEPDRDMNWLGSDHDYTDGVDAEGTTGVVLDNNELYGWPKASVINGKVHVHHNYIHDNDQSGLGYGVSDTDTGSVIEYNQFRRNRHSITGSGAQGNGYIARYNIFGSEGINGAGHKIDMHEKDNTGWGGDTIKIYRNTVKFDDAESVYLRATPRDQAEIHHNWFYNTKSACLDRQGDRCTIQLQADDWTNVDYWGNHLGSSEPANCDVGAPRPGC